MEGVGIGEVEEGDEGRVEFGGAAEAVDEDYMFPSSLLPNLSIEQLLAIWEGGQSVAVAGLGVEDWKGTLLCVSLERGVFLRRRSDLVRECP